MWQSRYQGRVPYAPQMQVAAYPSALQRLAPDVLATPWAPQAPVAPAAPSQVPMAAEAPMIGPMVGAMDNFGDANSAGYAGDMPGPSPNQSFGGMLDAAFSGLGLLGGPLGAAGLLGGFAVAADRGLTQPALGPLSVMAQIAGLGTLGQTVDGMMGGSGATEFSGTIGMQTDPGLTNALLGAPVMGAGLISGQGSDPGMGSISADLSAPVSSGFVDAMLGAPVMGAGLIGGAADTSYGGQFGIGSGFGGGSAGGAGMSGTADGATGW